MNQQNQSSNENYGTVNHGEGGYKLLDQGASSSTTPGIMFNEGGAIQESDVNNQQSEQIKLLEETNLRLKQKMLDLIKALD